jgi:hypothetical protein
MKDLAIFGISTLTSLISSVIGGFYLWPRLRAMDRAMVPLVAPHMFLRFIGLSFLVPGVVSPSLPAGLAIPTAYGDLVAGVLAVLATVALLQRIPWAIAAVWLFNIWGAADFLFAFYQGLRVHLHPGDLGAAFFIPTTLVPPLLVTHALIFGLLVRAKR